MRVELLKHWRGFPPGKVFDDLPDGSARVLIQRGKARELSAGPATAAKPATKPKRKP